MSGLQILLTMIVLPAIAALLILIIPKKAYAVKSTILLLIVVVNLIAAISLWGKEMTFLIPWGGFGIDLSLRVYHFSSFIIAAAAGFTFLVGLYSVAFLRGKPFAGKFYFYYLISLAMVNGAVLANNLVVMLFFWEGLLVTLFGTVMVSSRDNFPTAVKSLTLSGFADLLLMVGIGITAWQAGTFAMDSISAIPVNGIAVLGFVCFALGAMGKAGSMPFHSWIPDAAIAAPLPFMAFMPAALEKLLGIYLLARICLNFYALQPGTGVSIFLMTIGSITIVLAVAMALIQKNYKRLLSYHAISQVGYMVLGIGTGIPVGIVGGLFHMINHAMYKSCLFLTGGSVEKQTGTTDLKKLGGLGKYMPITTICFLIAAASISGVPPFNGFFSKELVFDAAMESGMIFYIAAVVGAFLTAASFLKLGHAAFFGKSRDEETTKNTKEAPLAMLIPMIVIAAGCVLFGVWNALPLRTFIQPILGHVLEGEDFAGWPHSATMVIISVIVLLLAVANHSYGVKKTGNGLGSVDHIHYAPVLRNIYNGAEKHYFDPFDLLMWVVKGFSWLAFGIDRAIDWLYNVFFVFIVSSISRGLKIMNNGSQSRYLAWAFTGFVVVLFVFIALV